MHVDGSRRCSTIAAMTGACGPLSRSRSGIGLDSKSELAEFNSLAACLRGLGLADGECEEEAKARLGESPGDHALAPSRVNDRFICDTSRVQFPPVLRLKYGV